MDIHQAAVLPSYLYFPAKSLVSGCEFVLISDADLSIAKRMSGGQFNVRRTRVSLVSDILG